MPTEDVGSWRFADGRKDRSRAGWSWKRPQSMLAADWTAELFFSAGSLEARRRARWQELARPRVGRAAKQLSFGRENS